VALAISDVILAQRVLYSFGAMNNHHETFVLSDNAPKVVDIMLQQGYYANNAERDAQRIDRQNEWLWAQLAIVGMTEVCTVCRGLPQHDAYDLTQLQGRIEYTDKLTKMQLETSNGAPLKAGGLREAMYETVYRYAFEWLCSFYQMLVRKGSSAANTSCSSDSPSDLLVEQINTLAKELSLRAVGLQSEGLSTHALELMASSYRRCGDKEVTHDRDQIQMMIQLLRCETVVEVLVMITKNEAELSEAIKDPPIELSKVLVGDPRFLMLLSLFSAESCSNKELQAAKVFEWRNRHHAFIDRALASALHAMNIWRDRSTTLVLPTLHRTSERINLTENRLDSPSYLPLRNTWTLASGIGSSRTGLKSSDESAVRLISGICELLAHGEFQPGQVSAWLVDWVTSNCMTETRLVNKLLLNQYAYEGLHIGPLFEVTNEELSDSDGQFSTEVAIASRRVCLVPVCQLFEFLDCASPSDKFSENLKKVGRYLRPMLNNSSFAGYDWFYPGSDLPLDFVYDTLAMTIPAIASMRGRLHYDVHEHVHPLSAGLLISDAIRDWIREYAKKGVCTPLTLSRTRLKLQLPTEVFAWLTSDAMKSSPLVKTKRTHRKDSPETICFPRVDLLLSTCQAVPF
jgi:hypothetical protein